MATGNWNLFGINLPELGITEKFGGNKKSITYSSPAPASYSSYQSVPSNSGGSTLGAQQTPNYQPPKQPSGGSGGGSGYSKRDIFRQLGLDVNDASNIYRQYGVDNALDLYKAFQNKRADTSGIEKLINDRYNSYLNYVDQSRAGVPGLKQTDIDYLGQQRENMQSSLDTARNYASSNLASQKQTGIRELADQFRSGADAANMMIGSVGGGNSSATGMASYALQKQANKGATALQREQMARQADIDNTYQTELAGLNEWYATNEKSTTDYYNQYLQQLEQMKQTAGDVKYDALTNLQEYIVEKAQNALDTLRQQATQRSQQLQDYAMQRMAELNNAKISMANSTFDPYATLASEMDLGTSIGLGGGGETADNPYLLKKKQTDYLA